MFHNKQKFKISKLKKMKTKAFTTSLVVLLFVAFSAMAKNDAKVIAVVNKAEWCPTCKENGMRAMAALKANNTDGSIQFIMNDLTNDETKKQSAGSLKKAGLKDAMAKYNGTGNVYFFDAKSKKLLDNVSVAKDDEKLAATLASVKSEVK